MAHMVPYPSNKLVPNPNGMAATKAAHIGHPATSHKVKKQIPPHGMISTFANTVAQPYLSSKKCIDSLAESTARYS
jgi:hypothetical protein